MRKYVGPIRCSVQGCKNTNLNSSRSFFRLPKCKKRARRWMDACPLTDHADLSKIKVCSDHFENCYLNSHGNRLMADPVPTIFPSFHGPSTPSSDSQWFEISAHTDGAGQEHNNFINDGRIMTLDNGLIVTQYVVPDIELPPLVPIKRGRAALEFNSLSRRSTPYSRLLDDDTVPPLVPISRQNTQWYPSSSPCTDVPPLVPFEPASRKSETTCYADVKLEDNPLTSTMKMEEIDIELTTVKVEESERIAASDRTEVGLDLKKEEDQDLDEKADIRLLIDSESAESYFDAPDYVWIKREP
ncbi:unnamed protein product [Phaedon cochleariae]|uniref:THAP-type domain-containing protein n=1 Tax=Phaedon cochleariae TaxID=80249 RepID=A0A9P0DTL6_PHACE|nr:unnamed protein product [Phaedon cochleariae]